MHSITIFPNGLGQERPHVQTKPHELARLVQHQETAVSQPDQLLDVTSPRQLPVHEPPKTRERQHVELVPDDFVRLLIRVNTGSQLLLAAREHLGALEDRLTLVQVVAPTSYEFEIVLLATHVVIVRLPLLMLRSFS